MKDLEEAIKHAEEVTEEKEKDARFYTFSRPDNYRKENSEKCAAEHRQLAEWLKDYKRLLEQEACKDAAAMTEELDFIQPKKTVGKMISAEVLDKIRAEIEKHRRKTQSIDPYDLVGDCLDIIDKYKESEDKE